VDRGTSGSKIHVLSERGGLPSTVTVSTANTDDSLALKPLAMAIPAVQSRLVHRIPTPEPALRTQTS
jgi:hypothetical protein